MLVDMYKASRGTASLPNHTSHGCWGHNMNLSMLTLKPRHGCHVTAMNPGEAVDSCFLVVYGPEQSGP